MVKNPKKGVAEYLAELAATIGKRTYSDEDLSKVRQHLLDAIAAAFIGCRGAAFKALTQLCPVANEGCPWPGSGSQRLNSTDAGMTWAFAINASVFEDGSREGACHPAAAVVPAVVAFGGNQKWDHLDRALLAGYEVMVRVARSANPGFIQRGFHPTSVSAPFGAATTASALLSLNPEETAQALSLAALGASGLMKAFKQGSTQPLQVAWAVRSGLQSALLAKDGHHGYDRIIEEGFYPAYLGNSPKQTVDFPLSYPTALGGSYLKPTPGCRHLQPALDAVASVLRGRSVALEQIERIRIGMYATALQTEINDLNSRGDAYFNIPYAIAAYLVLKRNDWDAFNENHFKNKHIRGLLKKVEVYVDSSVESLYPEQRGAKVSVFLSNGSTLSGGVQFPLGEPENPLPLGMTREKLHAAAGTFLPPEIINKLETILKIPHPNERFGTLLALVSGESNEFKRTLDEGI
ncbi:MAG: MmgE/PrpD family protein [Desulfobacterales bacterium]|jgi:2-methylcitrate dehydratase PrpD